jgi:hypothetical protein
MSRTQNKVIGALAAALAVVALAPAASFAGLSAPTTERTATELGQAVGEPGEQGGARNALESRTPTELAQRVAPSAASGSASSGFDWGDAAIGAGAVVVLGLTGFGGFVLMDRRRHSAGSARVPAVSS